MEHENPIEPGVYRHFKGGRYEVIGVGTHTETGEALVFYRTLYGERSFWVRPASAFAERVDRDAYSGPRFVREPADAQPGAGTTSTESSSSGTTPVEADA